MAASPVRAGLGREHIVESALGLIAEVGVDQMSMRQLSAALGVSLGATYRHVPTKESLLALCGRALYLRSYRPREPDEDAIEWVRALVIKLYDLLAEHPGMAGYVVRAQGLVAPEVARDVHSALLEMGHTPVSADLVGLVLTYYAAGVLLAETESTIGAAGVLDPRALVVAGLDFILRNYSPGPLDPGVLPGRAQARPVGKLALEALSGQNAGRPATPPRKPAKAPAAKTAKPPSAKTAKPPSAKTAKLPASKTAKLPASKTAKTAKPLASKAAKSASTRRGGTPA